MITIDIKTILLSEFSRELRTQEQLNIKYCKRIKLVNFIYRLKFSRKDIHH